MSSGNPRKLFGDLLRSVVRPMLTEFGASDRKRLEQILDLATTERIGLGDCLTTLFPGTDPADALKAFTNLRGRFNQIAEEKAVEIQFVADSKKRDAPPDRYCWFEGADPAVALAKQFSEETTSDLAPGDIRSRAILTDLARNQIVIRVFVSYAHDDSKHADAFIDELKRQFKSSRYQLKIWIDTGLHSGEKWEDRIQAEIANCDFGLFLVSPGLQGSEYVRESEVPHFLGTGKKPAFLIALRQFDKSQDRLELCNHQIYGFPIRFYESLGRTADKTKFVHEFFLNAQSRLDQWVKTSGSPIATIDPPSMADDRKESRLRGVHHSDEFLLPDDTPDFQPTRGIATTLAGLVTLDGKTPGPDQARNALEELEVWATNPDAPPFFALLGEYGIGKTTTLKQFTRQFLTKLKDSPGAKGTIPLPIYIDLRDYVGERKEVVPTIEELLDEVIRRAWKLTDRTVTAKDILRLVREEGALIIFDGLDEKIVHLTPEKAQAFIRTLWAALPDTARRKDAAPPPVGIRRGKMILSCRSHYFRNVMSQNAMLVGEDREGFDTKSYPALCLLPFTEDQIRSYLRSCLGDPDRARDAFDLIARVHNLPELAPRPYLLTLITSKLEELEDLSIRGETVNAARLYDLFVQSWLNRDNGKHQIDPAHKRRLMEDLAAAMWRKGVKRISVDNLESWLDKYLIAKKNQDLASAYAHIDRTILKEDLRTATFILRPDTEEKHFRFAHTSLQEFFLASYLARALRERAASRWDLPMPSAETLDFFGQILAWERLATDLETLNTILGGACQRAAVVAFRYWLTAIEKNLPAPQPPHVNLAGADLEEWTIRGISAAQPLGLRGANLASTRLNRSRVEHVDLTGADLTGLEARQALFLDVNAAGKNLTGADFAGLKWRVGSLAGRNLTTAHLHCQWIDVDLANAALPADWLQGACSVAIATLLPLRPGTVLELPDGHFNWVSACGWSPDGRRIVSGSSDNSLRVWDAQSGDCVLTLQGHSNRVSACGWSPDGRRIVSGSSDNSLRVWDAQSGDCVLTLQGHSNSVMACGWSPDGRRIVSGSDDNSLRVWDAQSGDCVLTLQGHSNWVMACGWSPDGRRIVSGSDDKSLRVWDAQSGQCVLTLQGHSNSVMACGWSPDGRRIVSGSSDNSLKVWDAQSGQCVLTLQGHSNSVMACGWSPDGRRIVSGSSDNSLKVWDAQSGQCVLTLQGHSNSVMACGWSPDGRRIVSGSDDNSLRVWDAQSGQCVLTLQGHSNSVMACGWSPDGRRIVSGSDDKSLRVWDAQSGQCVLTLQGHSNWVMACGWSPDGRRIVSGSSDKSLKVWDAQSGQCVLTLQGHSNSVMACGWSPDGRRIVSGSSDNSLRVWDAQSGQCVLTLQGHSNSVMACGWSPDGRRIVSGSSDNSLKVWDAQSGQCVLTLQGHSNSVRACGWSPDGRRIVSGSSDNSLKVWDAQSGQCVLTLQGHSNWVMACGWSPDGRRIVSGSSDKSLRVWDAQSGDCVLTLQGHSNSVMACGWSPDGRRIVSGSSDNSLRVWDAQSSECLWTGHLFPEMQVAAIDHAANRVLYASPEAWRFIGWRVFDPEIGHLRLLPAETFGPLPG